MFRWLERASASTKRPFASASTSRRSRDVIRDRARPVAAIAFRRDSSRSSVRRWLEAELRIIRPKLLIPVGQAGDGEFLPSARSTTIIGKVHEVEHAGGRSLVIPLPHPSGASSWIHAPGAQVLLERALSLIGAELERLGVRSAPAAERRMMRGLALVFGLHAGDHWFGADKVKHFFMSAFVASVTYSALRASSVHHDPALVAASSLTLGVGMGKEIYDRHSYGPFSLRDLTWDVAGNAAAAACSRTRK